MKVKRFSGTNHRFGSVHQSSAMGKKDKGSVKKSSDGEDLKREQKLQAVVLADSFMKTFRPISWEKPKVRIVLNSQWSLPK